MKRNALACLLLTAALYYGCDPAPVVIEGEVADRTEGRLYLLHYAGRCFSVIDSTNIAQGNFRLQARLNEGELYGLSTRKDNRKPATFFPDGQHLRLKLWSRSETLLTASPLNAFYQQTLTHLQNRTLLVDTLVDRHAASPVTAYLLSRQLAARLPLDQLRAYRSRLSERLSGNRYVEQLDRLLHSMEATAPGCFAPNFTLPAADGTPVTLSDLNGHTVVLAFWASWCPDCSEELPQLARLFRALPNRDIVLVTFSLDTQREDAFQALRRHRLPGYHVCDELNWKSPVVADYAVRGIPHLVLISPAGRIVCAGLSAEQLEQRLRATAPSPHGTPGPEHRP